MANKQLQEKLKNYISENGSLSSAAKAIGLSPATLSTYLKDKYEGNIANVETRLTEIFETVEAANNLLSRTNTVGYVETSISMGVYKTIRLCHLKGGIARESGDAGIGKTMAAKQYIKDYPNSAIYISVNPCTSGVVACLKLICKTLRLRESRKDDMWFAISNALSGEKVLIVDEAQHLPIKTVEALRAFSDVNPQLGICLIGNLETAGSNNKPAYAQIANRTKIKQIRLTSDIEYHDIELLCPALHGKKEVTFLLNIAHSPQGLRGAINVYSNALDNQYISYEGLSAMASAMQITMN